MVRTMASKLKSLATNNSMTETSEEEQEDLEDSGSDNSYKQR
jgi:hypothetical protein